jgi:steroid 5-alpha reductase family enzyme
MSWLLIVAVTGGLSLAMMGAWLAQWRTHNAGWVDVVWTFALGAAGVTYALLPGAGASPRQWLVAALVLAWSLRLGVHLAERTWRGPEDRRYAQFRQDWGAGYEARMFGLLQVQAVAAAVLALSMLLAAHNPAPLGVKDLAAPVILVVAVCGAGLADVQLERFRRDPANRGLVCSHGLWRWSRHPNYFFEWLGWFAYPALAIDVHGLYPLGWLALSGPAFMYALLVHVSGIPPLERQMLRTRGAAYAEYRARTGAFFPAVPPRRAHPRTT